MSEALDAEARLEISRRAIEQLELDTDEDPDWWPEEAIAGLRDVAEVEARS